MAKFKCIQSGNIIEFVHEVDIKSTRRNKAYVEVIETPVEVQEAPVAKKAGRPAKVTQQTTSEE